jgi:PAS domain S-box-containing protein
MTKTLLVEDNPADARLLQESLKEPGPRTFVVTRVTRLAEAISAVQTEKFDVILLDLTLPDSTGLDTVQRLTAVTSLPIVVLTGMQNEELGLQAVRQGVQDYLVKGQFDPHLTARAVRYAVERSRVEQELRDREARLDAIVKTAADAILIFDRSDIIESANPAAANLFGYSADELAGLNVRELVDPDSTSVLAELRTELEQDAAIRGVQREILCLRKDRSTFPALASISGFKVGGAPMYTAILHDISNRRRLEKEVLDAAAAEQRRIAHDLHDGLCQHLLATSLSAEVLARRMAPSSPDDAASVTQIAQHLRDSISQARSLSHGLNPIDVREGGLSASLQDLADRMSAECGITCEFVQDANAPDVDAGTALQLYRIAQEAISNAIRHGKATAITLKLSAADGRVSLAIRDNGVGISEKSLKSGLGLHTMAHRARVIGGRLNVSREPEGGTLVVCRIRKGLPISA